MKMNLQSKNINYSDLNIIAKLIAGKDAKICVFDPNGKVVWDTKESNSDNSRGKQLLFNLGEALVRFKSYELSDFDFVIDFNALSELNNDAFKTEKLNLIQAPNGTVRYMFQAEDKSYSFLDFLPIPSLRSRIIKKGLQLTLKLGLKKLIAKNIHISYQEQPKYKSLAEGIDYDHFSIFLGTPGFWRKPVMQLIKNQKAIQYLKIGITPQTYDLVEKERFNLRMIKGYQLNQISIPKINSIKSNGILSLKAIPLKDKKQINRFSNHHFLCIKELMLKSMRMEKLSRTPFFEEILDQMYDLRITANPNQDIKKLLFQLSDLKSTIQKDKYCYTSLAHGDLTPWNTALVSNSMYVFDWEMALTGAPLLYDVFNFIYQSEILVNRSGIKGVEREIQKLQEDEEFVDFIARFNIDIAANHKLYLLHMVSKNLSLMTRQSQISQDQKLLIENWKIALSKYQDAKQIANIDLLEARKVFLMDFQTYLSDVDYAALKFFLPNFRELPIQSDLDLAISEEGLKHSIEFIGNHVLVKSSKLIEKSFMSTIKIHFVNGAYLCIDFITDFTRKGIRYLDCETLLDLAVVQGGVKRASLWSDISYIQLFYTLNKSGIPLKYQHYLIEKLNTSAKRKTYLEYLKETLTLEFEELLNSFEYSKEKHIRIKKSIQKKHNLGSFGKLRGKVSYLRDFWVDLVQNKGFMLTFSGVDGAGKTTIITEVKERLENKYRKEVVLLRHRPGILPILSAIKHGSAAKAEQKAGENIPRQGKNNNIVSSLFRFSYYYFDYLIGQIYVYFKYILRGKVVIYDRYYFDFINDAKRSNIRMNRNIIKKLFAFFLL